MHKRPMLYLDIYSNPFSAAYPVPGDNPNDPIRQAYP